MNTDKDGKVTKVTVGTFLESGRTPLMIEMVSATRGLENHIIEATLNRPGLALSGEGSCLTPGKFQPSLL